MTADEIAKLPTLLDIVNHYLEGERRIEELHESGSFKGLFPTRAYKGIFEPLRMDDGTHILMPLSPHSILTIEGRTVITRIVALRFIAKG